MGHDGPIKGISCRRLGKGYFRNDREWVITNVQADFGIELDQNFRGSYDDSSDLIQVLESTTAIGEMRRSAISINDSAFCEILARLASASQTATWVSM
jgi:hypothetical protein